MPTNNEILDAMRFDLKLLSIPLNTTESPAYIFEYQFAGTAQPADLWINYSGWTAMSGAEKAAIRQAMDHIETVANVSFVEVFGSANPDLNIGKVNIPGSTTGYGGFQYSTYSPTNLAAFDSFAVFDNTLDLSDPYWAGLLLHELGHGLTLKHPFSGNAVLPDAYDNNKYSVMAYNNNPDTNQDVDAMMLYDILALQSRWGQNDTYNAGDTIYSGPRNGSIDPVWDTGGHDRLDASAYSTDVILDLNTGNFSRFGTVDDLVIPFGVVIEDAYGGTGNDTLIGNAAANTLNGLAGDDTLYGGGGDDLLIGGQGSDTIYVDSIGDRVAESRKWAGTDTVISSVDFRMGRKHIENLELTGDARLGAGNGLKNIITGNDADNTLDGGKNVDTLIGGKGNDVYYLRSPGDTAVEFAGEGIDIVKSFRSIKLGANIEKLYIQTLRNAAGEGVPGVNGIGNELDNTIVGNPFDNFITGREGNDTLKGQGGADTFVFDRALGANNVDRIIDFGNGDDALKLKASLFIGMSAGGLSVEAFHLCPEAETAEHRFIFDADTGELFFDRDGIGAAEQQLVATFDGGVILTEDDFTFF